MRITNINTISALIDRLTTEHVKRMSFVINNQPDQIVHQDEIIKNIKAELLILFTEVHDSGKYEYLKEFRSTKPGIVNKIEEVITVDLENVEAEKCRAEFLRQGNVDLMTTLKNDLWLRLGNEKRAHIKNELDESFKDYIETDMSLVDAGFKFGLAQVRSEIEELVELLAKENLNNMLEIGSKLGGNFYILAALTTGKKISVDLQGGAHGGWILNDHPYLGDIFKRRNEYFNNFKDTHMVSGDSTSQNTVNQVSKILDGELLDLLYIDGDHSYDGVLKDFELYSPFVAEGGYIIFHDIVDSDFHRKQECGVAKLWNEIKPGYKNTREIMAGEHWGGIGVIKC